MSVTLGGIKSFLKTDTEYLLQYDTGELAKLNILNSHVFKFYMSPTGDFLDYPKPKNPEDYAKINIKKITDYDTEPFKYSILKESEHCYHVYTNKISISFDKKRGTMTVQDLRTNKDVLIQSEPLYYDDTIVKQTLVQHKSEYFFGGGMQNGRFSHKGEKINIVNSNKWVDGGVTSPCPFYWSTNGYAVLINTWQAGVYDFGTENTDIVKITHNGNDFDAFFFISSNARDILKDYYELTGQPTFMPEYSFYEAHLNAFNRDYWVKVDKDKPNAILFEDGFYYKCYQPNDMEGKEGILESLNGEKNNYQFSARAMVDRYQRHDMPLGWFIPNDGYGCGYGQTDSLEGDIDNLKQFQEYSKTKGVETALWTESNLEPKDPDHPVKGDRDLAKEVGVAGVVALKCDVAWIGSGYSFALTAVDNATKVFNKGANHKARTMIIMVDGWAGTQRYAGIWSGDQTGGQWEYIRFHIPTYIGSGLSGIPIVGSDMDGIYGGGVKDINVRDYQWKAFTPLQLNMDGWGKAQKTPFCFDDEAKAINRAYLKLKSMFMPYNYTIGHESIHGLPMVRAMFLEFPDENCGYTKDSQYQYMWGPFILVAPVYKEQYNNDKQWVRHGVYLPNSDQVWVDLLTGEKYQGGKIWNDLKTPLWKIPIFVKDGAIIPMVNPNNNPNEIERENRIFNIYPNGETTFKVYEDDGKSPDYLKGHHAKTEITVVGPNSNGHGDLFIHVHKTEGSYNNIVKERSTIFRVMASEDITHIKATINDNALHIPKVETVEEFNAKENAYFFNKEYVLNPYLKDFAGDTLKQKCLMIKVEKTDVTASDIHIKLKGFQNKGKIVGSNTVLNKTMKAPGRFTALDEDIKQTSVTLQWDQVKDVSYEIERDGTLFTNIKGTKFTFEGFKPATEHKFRIRSVSDEGVSKWSYYILVETMEDPAKYLVEGVKVVCNIPCQPRQEVFYLTDGDPDSLWHTHWGKPGQADPKTGKTIDLKFDLGEVYDINRMEYTPRDDAGNGTILKFQYRFSVDNKEYSSMSSPVDWKRDPTVKTVLLNNQKMRFVELIILETVGGFGSGINLLFFANKC
ncbi:alpha-glucosidase 2-like [Anticarsia gemmatalis]|uniref:alpha-glucosidase 2-like n=1 Tax=Anticarsia gemmatalis TaxID=129554 RepID=UPI003F760BC2